jgi:hypothetical protein
MYAYVNVCMYLQTNLHTFKPTYTDYKDDNGVVDDAKNKGSELLEIYAMRANIAFETNDNLGMKYVFMYVCVYLYMYICVDVDVDVHVHVHVYVHVYVYVYMFYVYVICMYTNIYTYTYTYISRYEVFVHTNEGFDCQCEGSQDHEHN